MLVCLMYNLHEIPEMLLIENHLENSSLTSVGDVFYLFTDKFLLFKLLAYTWHLLIILMWVLFHSFNVRMI